MYICKNKVPEWFYDFIDMRADRASIVVSILEKRGIATSLLTLAGGRFVIAHPKKNIRDKKYRLKIFTAHHDRVPNSPGALDNSAACLQLVDFLSDEAPRHNTVVIFSDKEERSESATSNDVGAEQGSYILGTALPEMGLSDALIFSLDVTGRGDILLVSSAASKLAAQDKIMSPLAAEVHMLSDILLRRCRARTAPLPFGEDLGFMRAGIPALLISVLPADEAALFVDNDALPSWASLAALGGRAPETWRFLHSPDDTPRLFTDAAFKLMKRTLDTLGAIKLPASCCRQGASVYSRRQD